jgi:hypothetical protein
MPLIAEEKGDGCISALPNPRSLARNLEVENVV